MRLALSERTSSRSVRLKPDRTLNNAVRDWIDTAKGHLSRKCVQRAKNRDKSLDHVRLILDARADGIKFRVGLGHYSTKPSSWRFINLNNDGN